MFCGFWNVPELKLFRHAIHRHANTGAHLRQGGAETRALDFIDGIGGGLLDDGPHHAF